MTKKEFFKGFNIFHVVGLCLMFAGVFIPNYEYFKDFQGGFTTNALQIVGAVSFFKELVHSWIKGKK